MTREDPQLKIRLPDGIRDRLKAEAERNKRSMNAEIVARLERTMREDDRAGLVDDGRERNDSSAPLGGHIQGDWNFERADVSDFEREFVAASQEMMLRLMRKHGMNPVDARQLPDRSEDHTSSSAPSESAEAPPKRKRSE